MPRRVRTAKPIWQRQQDHAQASSVWPMGPLPTTGAGGSPGGPTYVWTDGYLFSDVYENGAADATTSGTTVVQDAANSATHDQITVLARSLKWTGAASGGKLRVYVAGGLDLDLYDAMILTIRDANGTSQDVNIGIEDSSGTQMGNLAPYSPPVGSASFPGNVQRFGGDADAIMRFFVVPLGADDATLIGSPYNGEAGGQGIGLAASGRGRGYYFTIANASGAARVGSTYIDEWRLIRRVAANMPAAIGDYAENALPLNMYLNYVPGLTLDRTAIPSSPTPPGATFLPYWQAVCDWSLYNGAPVAGTTEEILEYAAWVFGFAPGSTSKVDGAGPPALTAGGVDMIQGDQLAQSSGRNFLDLMKAQAVQETNWAQMMSSDWSASAVLDGLTCRTWRSWGIGQQSWPYYGPPRYPFLSTVFSALYKAAIVRWIFDGDDPTFNGMTPSPTGNIRLSLAAYYQGSGGTIANNGTYQNNILGWSTSPNGFINTRDWTTRTWPWSSGKMY